MIAIAAFCILGMGLIPVLIVIEGFTRSLSEGLLLTAVTIGAFYWLYKAPYIGEFK